MASAGEINVMLTCLICGKTFRSLGFHVFAIHSLSGNEYKEKFGIPRMTKLVSSSTKEKMRENRLTVLDRSGERGRFQIYREKALQVKRDTGCHQPKRVNSSINRIRASQTDDGIAFDISHAEAFLQELLKGKKIKEVAMMKGFPGATWWHTFNKENSTFRKRVEEAIEQADFITQSNMKKLGIRFVIEISRLRSLNYSWPQVEESTGISMGTCQNYYSGRVKP